jgi:cardiolipin synthase
MNILCPMTQDSAAGSKLLEPAMLEELSRRASAPARTVESTRLLRDGDEAFPVMLDLVENARESVLFENFIFAGDATGERFARAFGRAVRRGVEVRVLYDPVGTMMVNGGSAAKLLREQRVASRAFRPVYPWKPATWSRLRHRDHRKTMVVDGEVAVVGGLCISNNWAGHNDGGHNWRDTALMVRGGLVADVAFAFACMWRRAEGEELPVAAVFSETPPGVPCGIVAADQPGAHHVASVYIFLASQAQRSLDITDAYLVTPEPVVAAFEAAARRGVRVRFLLPGNNNHRLAGASARRLYARLMAAGAEIHEWRGMMVHAKTVVADGVISLVGSSNLDPLSMTRNYELNLLVADPVTGAQMDAMFERDLNGARRIDPEQWARRSFWKKACETAAGLFDDNL